MEAFELRQLGSEVAYQLRWEKQHFTYNQLLEFYNNQNPLEGFFSEKQKHMTWC